MSNTGLIFALFSVLSGVLIFGVWSNIHAYAQQSSSATSLSPAATGSSRSTTISQEVKAKMCDPSNPGLKVVNTTEARICGIPKTIKNTTATAAMSPPTTAASSPSSSTPPPTKLSLPAANVAATKQQKITASNNNSTITPAASQLPKQTAAGKGITTPPVDPVRSVSDKSSLPSSKSTIAPQINAINKGHQQQKLLPTASNATAGQNYTPAATPPAVTLGKLIYLGYQGSTTSEGSSSKDKDKQSSDTKPFHSDSSSSSSKDKDKQSSDSKSSSSHNDDSSRSSSSSIIKDDISSVIVKSFNFKHSRHSDNSDNKAEDTFFKDSSFEEDSFFSSNPTAIASSSSSTIVHEASAAASASAAAGGSAATASASASS
jgi:hypothetical protein